MERKTILIHAKFNSLANPGNEGINFKLRMLGPVFFIVESLEAFCGVVE